MIIECRLPELGENITTATVAKVLVRVGQDVTLEQPLLEVETDKATLEIPSPAFGRVRDVRVKEGERIEVGQLLLTLEDKVAAREVPPDVLLEAAPAVASAADGARPESMPEPMEPSPTWPVPEPVAYQRPERSSVSSAQVVEFVRPAAVQRLIPAAPSVRRLARELGVDITAVKGTGPGGRISAADVLHYARQMISRPQAEQPSPGVPSFPLPDFSRWGEIERRPMTSVRRTIAERLSTAWMSAPRVTHADRADVTDLEEMRRRYAARAEARGGKLTLTAILLKVVAAALKAFPQFNASVDPVSQEIIYKKYYHIGVAVDTERGLLVPVIRDVDRKNILELAVDVARAADRARQGKLTVEDMQGATFTITNLGGIGGTFFTPIVNVPEVAILGVARAQIEPLYRNGQFEPRLLLPLCLSYDHRLIDGADAARFVRWIVEALEQPFLLALEG